MIYGFVGLPGTGKTLSAVHHLTDKIRKGCKVYSNTPINILFSKNQPIFVKNRELLEALVFEMNATFFIDEAQIVFDPYVWNRTNPSFLYKFSQGRKMDLDLVYTTQRFNHVLKRLRELTNFMIKCTKIMDRLFSNIWYDPEIWEKSHLFGTPMEEKYIMHSNHIFPWEVKKIEKEYQTKYLIEPFNAADFSIIMEKYKKDEDGNYIRKISEPRQGEELRRQPPSDSGKILKIPILEEIRRDAIKEREAVSIEYIQ